MKNVVVVHKIQIWKQPVEVQGQKEWLFGLEALLLKSMKLGFEKNVLKNFTLLAWTKTEICGIICISEKPENIRMGMFQLSQIIQKENLHINIDHLVE